MEEQKRKQQFDDKIAQEFEVEAQSKKGVAEGGGQVNFDFDFSGKGQEAEQSQK